MSSGIVCEKMVKFGRIVSKKSLAQHLWKNLSEETVRKQKGLPLETQDLNKRKKKQSENYKVFRWKQKTLLTFLIIFANIIFKMFKYE